MKAGRLRQRVTLEGVTTSQNTYGEAVPTWATVATVWAEVTPLMAQVREQVAAVANQISSRTPYQVRLRYRTGLQPSTHRVVWEGKTLEVEAVMDPEGRKRELVLMCYWDA